MSNLELRNSGRSGFARHLPIFVLLVLSVLSSSAQEPTPPPEKRGVQLEFVPPPMEKGTVSMGIYDSTGKLIRVLHQDAPTTDFFPALNGLITFWDGKDDSGKLMPAGKYRAKGFMMGEMDFEGVAFLCNDWITDEQSPHVRKITEIKINTLGLLEVSSELVNGQPGGQSSGGNAAGPVKQLDVTAEIVNGKLMVKHNGAEKEVVLAEGESPVDVSVGLDDMVWAIVKTSAGTEVRAYSAEAEFVRHLAIAATDPQPVSIKASPRLEEIYLLEENAKVQRVRTLQLSASPPPQASDTNSAPTSTWKVVSNKSIIFSDKLDQVLPLLKMSDGKPFVPQDKIGLRLLPNPLEQDKIGAVDISMGIDAKGSFLKAGDGLPLSRVSETPNLKWAAMAREADSKIITIFQSDGAVVEQFKAARLANMMAFDAGDFDFDPAKMK